MKLGWGIMKKIFSLSVILFMLVVGVNFLCACSNSISFNLNFIVDDSLYYSVYTNNSEKISIPKDPQKDGYIFDGWYWDKDSWKDPFTVNSLLNQPIKSEMNIYCKWRFESNDIEVHVYVNDIEVDTIKTNENKDFKIDIPDAPSDITNDPYSSYYFDGWFIDKNYQISLENDTIFNAESSVYAKMIEIRFNEFEYSISQGKAKITKYNNLSNSTSVVIPCYINSFVVDEIGSLAFEGQSMLREILILDGVTTIGSQAFMGCSSIKEIVVPASVTSIGESAFSGCSLLEKITLPFIGLTNPVVNDSGNYRVFGQIFKGYVSTDKFIVEHALPGCVYQGYSYEYDAYNQKYLYKYHEYEIPANLKEVVITNAHNIPGFSFMNCNMLTKITINKEAAETYIHQSCFENCNAEVLYV